MRRDWEDLEQRGHEWEAPAMAGSCEAKLHRVSVNNPGDGHHFHQETASGFRWTGDLHPFLQPTGLTRCPR